MPGLNKNRLEDILVESPKAGSGYKQIFGSVFKKTAKFIGSFSLLGVFDAIHPRSIDLLFKSAGKYLSSITPLALQYYLPIPNELYQFTLMSADAAFSFWSLYDKKASKKKNLSGLIITPVHSAGMDYTSAAVTLRNPLALPLPPQDYTWRLKAFNNTAWEGIAKWIDQPSKLIPGGIQGYDLAIYITLLYVEVKLGLSAYNRVKGRKYLKT